LTLTVNHHYIRRIDEGRTVVSCWVSLSK